MIAKKPPMGWNSWNTFGDKINEQLIKEMADRIVEDGYRDLGYEYVIIDDCWSLRERVDGKLVADPGTVSKWYEGTCRLYSLKRIKVWYVLLRWNKDLCRLSKQLWS